MIMGLHEARKGGMRMQKLLISATMILGVGFLFYMIIQMVWLSIVMAQIQL